MEITGRARYTLATEFVWLLSLCRTTSYQMEVEATMRKRLQTLGLLWIGLAAAQPATAQWARKFTAVTGGATISDFGGVNSSSRWGGTAGVSAGFRTSHYTVVTLETNWVQMGGGDTRLDYIDIPFTVGGVASTSGGAVRTRAYVGISLAFKVGCSATTTAFANCANANSTQWTVPLGIMIGRWTRPGTFAALDVRYVTGLSDVFATASAYNRSWQFRLLFGKAVGGLGGGTSRSP